MNLALDEVASGDSATFLQNFNEIESKLVRIIPDNLQEVAFEILIMLLCTRCENKGKESKASHKDSKVKYFY